MVSLDASVIPVDLVEKKKKKKNKKRKVEETGTDVCKEIDDIENNVANGESKPKKKKKNKEKIEAAQTLPAEAVPEEIKKVKKKKKKTTESGDCEAEEEEDSFDVDSGVFKKKFYTPDDLTQAMTKVVDSMSYFVSKLNLKTSANLSLTVK